jgi:hypothetical protein
VSVGFLSFRVKLFVAPVLICGHCLRYGHTRAQCRARQRCVRCGARHAFDRCPYRDHPEEAYCVHCNENHSAAYKGCRKYKEVSKALLVSAKTGVPFRDALLEVRRSVAEREAEQLGEQQPGPAADQQLPALGAPIQTSTPIKPPAPLPRRTPRRQPQRETRPQQQQTGGTQHATRASNAPQQPRRHLVVDPPPMRPAGAAAQAKVSQQGARPAPTSTAPTANTTTAAVPPTTGPTGGPANDQPDTIKYLVGSIVNLLQGLLRCLADGSSVEEVAKECVQLSAFATAFIGQLASRPAAK